MEEIAQAIRGLDLDCDVQVDITERTGYGVTWFKVLHIALEGSIFVGKAATVAAAKKIAEAVIDWARAQFNKSKRPVSISIYGPDGEVLKLVVVKPDGVEDRTNEDRKRREQFLKLRAEQEKSEKSADEAKAEPQRRRPS